jgi:hypothetical protein
MSSTYRLEFGKMQKHVLFVYNVHTYEPVHLFLITYFKKVCTYLRVFGFYQIPIGTWDIKVATVENHP